MMHWLASLVSDNAGKPDEAKLAFLLGTLAIIGLKIYSTICPAHPFNAADMSVGMAGLLGFYKIANGDLGKFGGEK